MSYQLSICVFKASKRNYNKKIFSSIYLKFRTGSLLDNDNPLYE